jgi:glycosyltransferase involved in cell wall biosynthesis
MRENKKISVIIPAINEEKSIGKVLADIPNWVDDVIVVDNGSIDSTAAVARAGGAKVIEEFNRGYGSACIKGMEQLQQPDIVVFLDGDYSDYPEEMAELVDPIIDRNINFVVGSRVLGKREKRALSIQARFGNWLACKLLKLFWGIEYSDLGPFRAIQYDHLVCLGMKDKNYGWTVEMQIKAVKQNLSIEEVPVRYRRRIGKSKVSGTLRGILGAGFKILTTIFIYGFLSRWKKLFSKTK